MEKKEKIDGLDLFKIQLENGLSLEEMESIYFDVNALRAAPRTVYRVGGTRQRVYYTLDKHNEPTFYSSVTSAISRNTPTSPFLIKWIADKGHEEAENYKEERADYGTFLHIELSNLLITRKCDLDNLQDRLLQYMDENKLPANFIYHSEELRKDILAFAQWVIDFNVKPLAVELVLADEKTGMAGAIDIVAEFDWETKGFTDEVYKTGAKKGQPKPVKIKKRIRAVIDNKSGRKGFYDSHKLQLELYRKIWNSNFPNIPIDRIFNWSPKDWRGPVPTYNFTDQTDRFGSEMTDLIIEMEAIKRRSDKDHVLIIQGEIDLNKGLEQNYYQVDLGEFITGRHNEK